jgi:hypothetical protein
MSYDILPYNALSDRYNLRPVDVIAPAHDLGCRI